MREGSTGKDMLEGDEIDKANADKIIRFMIERGFTIGLAESITAGGVSYCLTGIPGSSKVVKGGVVCYTRFAKEKLLSLPEALLDEQGTVSSDVAKALAESALRLFETDMGFGITGNAGPATDSDKSKVGQVYMAIASKDGDKKDKAFDFFGTRESTRCKSVTEALRFIREYLMNKYI
jgi:nicotinamide-nucleotide amidase